MADISGLGALRPVEQLDLDNYADAQQGPQTPKKGVYNVQAPAEFPATAFSRTAAGALSAQVDPTIIDAPYAGTVLRFTKVSAKPFQRNGATVSQLGDYLRACGFKGLLANEQEQADAVERTANTTYKVRVDWRAYNKATGFQLEGMEKFPSDGAGGYLPWVDDPQDIDPETGQPKRVRAFAVVTGYVPAGS